MIRFPLRASVAALALAAGGAFACSSAVTGASSSAGTASAPTDPRVAILRDTLQGILDQARADSAFPGAVAIVGTKDGVLVTISTGALDWTSSPPPDARTIWDLASLTKVVATTSGIARLVDEGRITLDAPVVRYLPEWRAPGADRIRVRDLLTHSSGMPSWRPLYKESETREAAIALVLATGPDTVPGARMVYSDLGAILLGLMIERVSGESLDDYVQRTVFGPLSMTDTRFRPLASEMTRIAPTEFDPWRQRLVRGEVHDENAVRLEGLAGHAGLFSTAADLARFARMYLNSGTLDGAQILSPATISAFTAHQNPALGNRALGWEKPTARNSAGSLMSTGAFGHTGFTGTSLWMDPERDVFVLLLTNRVNPTRQNLRIAAVRRAVADAALGSLFPGLSPRPNAP